MPIKFQPRCDLRSSNSNPTAFRVHPIPTPLRPVLLPYTRSSVTSHRPEDAVGRHGLEQDAEAGEEHVAGRHRQHHPAELVLPVRLKSDRTELWLLLIEMAYVITEFIWGDGTIEIIYKIPVDGGQHCS